MGVDLGSEGRRSWRRPSLGIPATRTLTLQILMQLCLHTRHPHTPQAAWHLTRPRAPHSGWEASSRRDKIVPHPSCVMEQIPKHSPREEHCPSPKAEAVLGEDGPRPKLHNLLSFAHPSSREVIGIGATTRDWNTFLSDVIRWKKIFLLEFQEIAWKEKWPALIGPWKTIQKKWENGHCGRGNVKE